MNATVGVSDRVGRKRIFMAGTTIFVIGSILAALSNSSSGLIWARVVQGIGGAMVLPSTLSTVSATFRGSARAAAFGVWGVASLWRPAAHPRQGGPARQLHVRVMVAHTDLS